MDTAGAGIEGPHCTVLPPEMDSVCYRAGFHLIAPFIQDKAWYLIGILRLMEGVLGVTDKC